MNIKIASFSTYTRSFFKTERLASLSIFQKISLIALGVLMIGGYLLGVYYIASHCCFKAKPLFKFCNKNRVPVNKEVVTNLLDDKSSNPSLERKKSFKNDLKREMKQAKHMDRTAVPNGWKQGLGLNEKEQTLEAFIQEPVSQLNAHRIRLKVMTFEGISARDRQILEIVSNYLQVVHGLETTLDPSPVTLCHNPQRYHPHPQYTTEALSAKILMCLPKDTFALGFTHQDLYPASHPNMNFIFGAGYVRDACGIFSTYRLGTNNFEQMLKRLMKLATHEFGHMRGLDHCTTYDCTMQGTNSVPEMDSIPLTFCAEDMAKICHLNGISLEKGYKNQLQFFENFFKHYGKKVNFSQEIAHLRKKIKKIASTRSKP